MARSRLSQRGLQAAVGALVAAALVASALGCGADGSGHPGSGGTGGGAAGATASAGGSSDPGVGGASSASSGASVTATSSTSASSTSVSSGGGPFDPSSLPGLELWLVGDHATANTLGTVSTWSDETFHHRDATQLQNAALQPSVMTNAPGLGGHAAVRFRQCNELQVAASSGLSFDSRDDSYFAVVASFAGASGPAYLFLQQVAYPSLSVAVGFNTSHEGTSSGLSLSLYRAGEDSYSAGTTNLYDDAVARVYSGKMRNGELVISVNGAVVATADSSPNEEFISGAPFQIGASSGTNCFNGDIAELLIVGNPNADTDGLEAYLLQKYGL